MSNKRRWGLAAGLALACLAGCRQPDAARPALWQVDGPRGERAWLFGTIHSLPRPAAWRSAVVGRALTEADRIVLEVAAIEDQRALEASFIRFARASGLVPLRQRVPVAALADFDRFVTRHRIDPALVDPLDTWAAALLLAQAAQAEADSDSANGVDRAVKQAAGSRPVEQFEGADAQFRIFDSLAEADQRELLTAVVSEGDTAIAQTRQLEAQWRTGDVAALEQQTRTGMMSDPELRAALLVGRNRDWSAQLDAMLQRGQRPFVAVGTAHLLGQDGVPALLTARGYRITRLQ